MKNLNDKTYRQAFIERYLDADTSIEEEKALADFYRHCKADDLTEEELDIRNLILGLGNYTQTSASNELPIEAQVESASKTTSKIHSSKNSSIRISAILLAAAMMAGLIFLVFPVKNMFSTQSTNTYSTPASTVICSAQSMDENQDRLSQAEEMERQDSLFLATTQNMGREKKEKIAHYEKAERARKTERVKETEVAEVKETYHSSQETEDVSTDDFNQLYEVASLALPTADQLKIDKQGNQFVVSSIDKEGNIQQFTIDTSDARDGKYQFQPLAQLN